AEPKAIFGFLFLVFLTVSIILTTKKKKYLPITIGLFWFLAALIPTSSIIPLAEVLNDHRMFFPLPGLIIALVWLLMLVTSRFNFYSSKTFRAISMVVVLAILFAFHYGTHERNKVWRTEETLWKDVTVKSPRNGRGLMNYGLTLMSNGNITEALAYFERAKTFTPAYPILFVNIAIAKDALWNAFEAENNFKIALGLAPDNPECNFYYARFLSQTKRNAEAMNYLNKTLSLSPAHLEAKKLSDQIQADEKKISLSPTPEYFLNLSLKLYNEKKFPECIDACHKALQLKPAYAEAYNNICSAYNEMKEYEKAMQACDSALKINPAFILAKNNFEYAKKMLKTK
ncbi:MAG: tetratricopeptide repeat protein, partial [Bacteroidia bacterium]|nr:tetratricopeptide repeat protein [Bacteroidia bacterium]